MNWSGEKEKAGSAKKSKKTKNISGAELLLQPQSIHYTAFCFTVEDIFWNREPE